MPTTSNTRYQFLDGLRGVAALLVVIFHFNNLLKEHTIYFFPKWIDWTFSQGHCGVEIFFIISGFVIAYSIRNQTITSTFFFKFFINRSIRLDPPYWITLLLVLTISLIGNLFKTSPTIIPDLKDISLNFFYLADLSETPRILPVSWTLALEIQFYIFLVLLVKIFQFFDLKFKSKLHSSFSLGALVILTFLMLASLLQNTSYALFPAIPGLFIYHWYSFVIGCLICWRLLNLIPVWFFWLNLGAIGLYSMAGHILGFETLIFALIIYTVAMQGKMHDLLKGPIFQYLGKISYSLYLIHWIVGVKIVDLSVRFLQPFIQNPPVMTLILIIAFALTVFLSDLFYRLVEQPCLDLCQKLKNKPKLASV